MTKLQLALDAWMILCTVTTMILGEVFLMASGVRDD